MTSIERAAAIQNRHEAMLALAKAGNPDAYSDATWRSTCRSMPARTTSRQASSPGGLRRRVAPFRRAQFWLEGRLLRSNQEHDAVVRAILSSIAAGAHAAMLHHVSLVEDAFEAFSASSAG